MMEDHQDHQEEGALSHMRQSKLWKEKMGKVVAAKSAINYAYQNGSFALFCYENEVLRDLVLEPWFIRGLAQCTTPTAKKRYLQEYLCHRPWYWREIYPDYGASRQGKTLE